MSDAQVAHARCSAGLLQIRRNPFAGYQAPHGLPSLIFNTGREKSFRGKQNQHSVAARRSGILGDEASAQSVVVEAVAGGLVWIACGVDLIEFATREDREPRHLTVIWLVLGVSTPSLLPRRRDISHRCESRRGPLRGSRAVPQLARQRPSVTHKRRAARPNRGVPRGESH